MRLIAYIAYCAAAVALYYILATALVEMTPVIEAERTARALAEQETEQVQAQQWGETLRVGLAWGAAAVVLVVVAVQAGRTLRHVHSERTRQRALLLLFARQHLPGRNVRVEAVGWRGDLVLRDYDKMEQWRPDAVRALLPMMEVDHD